MRIPTYDQLYQGRVPRAGNPYPSSITVPSLDPTQVTSLVGNIVNTGMDYQKKVFDSNATAYYNQNIVKLMADNERSKAELLNSITDDNAMQLPELYQQKVNENFAAFQNSTSYDARYTDMNTKLLKQSRGTVISSIPSLVSNGAQYVEKSILGKTDTAAESLGTTAITTGKNLTYVLEGTANLYHNLGKQKAIAPLTLQKHTMTQLARQGVRVLEDRVNKVDEYISKKQYGQAAKMLNSAYDDLINEKYLAIPNDNGVVRFYSYKNKSQEMVQQAADEFNSANPNGAKAYVANVKYMLGEDFDKINEAINKSRIRLNKAMRQGSSEGSSGGVYNPGYLPPVPSVFFSMPGVAPANNNSNIGPRPVVVITNNGKKITSQPSRGKSQTYTTPAIPRTRPAMSHIEIIGD